MAENSLSPAFVRINYTSPYGSHTMTLPSVPYILPDIGHVNGQFDLRGGELSVDADDAVRDFVDVIKIMWTAGTTFQDYVIFTQEDEEAAPLPRFSMPLGIVGTHGGTSWSKAIQNTFTWRTEAFGVFKLVMLDSISSNQFDKQVGVPDATARKAISDYVTDDSSWLSGRDGAQPGTFLQQATTLNEALRKKYGMN